MATVEKIERVEFVVRLTGAELNMVRIALSAEASKVDNSIYPVSQKYRNLVTQLSDY